MRITLSAISAMASLTVTTVTEAETITSKATAITTQTISASLKSNISVTSVQQNRTEVISTVNTNKMTESNQVNITSMTVSEQNISSITTESSSPVNPTELAIPPDYFFSFKDVNTGIRYSKVAGAVSDDLVNEYISEQMLTDKDNNGEISCIAELFSIKNITTEVMIAVKTDENGRFNLYRNIDYMPENLGEFINDTGIDAYALFNSAEYFDFSNEYELRNYYGFDTELIISFLRDCEKAVCYRYSELNPEQVTAAINLVCDMSDVVPLTAGFGISKKGYLTTNLTGGGLAFYIGEDKAADIINQIIETYPYSLYSVS